MMLAAALVLLAQDPKPKGERTLGFDVNEGQDRDYGRAFGLAKQAGMDATQLSVYWDDIEKSPGTYAPEPNFLAISNAFYPAAKTPLHLVVAVIDTSKKRVPADLAKKPLDDPALLERFKKLLDYIFSQIPAVTLGSLAIGNEIDGVLSDAKSWKEYRSFFEAAKAHAKARRPELKIGVKLMFSGALKEEGKKLNALTDVVMVNHYPLTGEFTVKDPGSIEADFDAVVAAYPNRAIYFTELGYPSGKTCKSSDALQGEFVRRMFRAWDKHAAAIRYVNFCILTDRPDSFVEQSAKYYGLKSPAFLEFLRTLGARTFDGKDKPAYGALKSETKARGW